MDASLTFVGTASALLRLGDVTVLTDPNFLHRGRRLPPVMGSVLAGGVR